MNQGLIGLAFAAGLVAALNPCGFAMLPAYLLLVVRGQHSRAPSSAARAWAPIGRAVAATIGMALGFMTVFGLFGALTISAAATVQRYLPYGTVVIGVVLVALGVWLLSGRELTAREIDVVRLLAGGQTNQEIAEELVVSVRTIERHIGNIYGKLGARGRAHATAYALTRGLI